MSKEKLSVILLAALVYFDATEANADSCPTVTDAIATDRPSQTNSSLVVPVGSLQAENGLNFSGAQGSEVRSSVLLLRSSVNRPASLTECYSNFTDIRPKQAVLFEDYGHNDLLR
jgi:hypothetical protein